MTDIIKEKAKIRALVLPQLAAQSAAERRTRSKIICTRVSQDHVYDRSRCLMFYAASACEVDTSDLIERALLQSKQVILPRVDAQSRSLVCVRVQEPTRDLAEGSYGILEPRPELTDSIDPAQLDVILVPGVAFDRAGRRLGRGKGYYDRFLSGLPANVKRYGLAFDFQLFEHIPCCESDVPVDRVFTNE